MSEKTTAFYRGNTEVSVDFSAEGVSSDGAVVLLEKLERKHKVIRRFSRYIPDQRDPSKVEHSVEKLMNYLAASRRGIRFRILFFFVASHGEFTL